MENPPEEAYGRVTNPGRFAPLIPAAETLIADLQRRFAVTVTRGPAPPTRSTRVTTLELVEITPAKPDQAPLSITFTSFPGLYLHAGAWQNFSLPACGCDGCDETAEQAVEELADYTEALTAGQLSERLTGQFRPVVEHGWNGEDWARSGTRTVSAGEAKKLRRQLVQPPADGSGSPGHHDPDINASSGRIGAGRMGKPNTRRVHAGSIRSLFMV
ncbi:DUF6226 family protein [Rhodococcus sp. USK13]|uniref:DUF6226 family protein n=1 Tax=Rhodococcus sp. USK13 TaxID=2806442 RepID=UPI001BCDE7C1|nr:DUF6226 family protein [Rhodococcus sp. USK13]